MSKFKGDEITKILLFLLFLTVLACGQKSKPEPQLSGTEHKHVSYSNAPGNHGTGETASSPAAAKSLQSKPLDDGGGLGGGTSASKGKAHIPPPSKPETALSSDFGKEEAFDFCAVPGILRQIVKRKTKFNNCSDVTIEDLKRISSLRFISVSDRDVSLLDNPKWADYLPSVQALDFSANKNLKHIPAFVFKLKNLQTLNISKTGIRQFGPAFCKEDPFKHNLRTLVAHSNRYEGDEMPFATFCLLNLENLYMQYSSLRYIDEYIFYLQKLEKLDLRGNDLTTLPAMFGFITTLTTVDLRDNRFQWEPLNFHVDCSTLEEGSYLRSSCEEDLRIHMECDYWHELPFERGRYGSNSFRNRYTDTLVPDPNINEAYYVRAIKDGCRECEICYNYWINDYVWDYHEPENRYLLNLSINGKTIREYRLMGNEIAIKNVSHTSCNRIKAGMSMERDSEYYIDHLWKVPYRMFFSKGHDWPYPAHGNEEYPQRFSISEENRTWRRQYNEETRVWERPSDVSHCPLINYDTSPLEGPFGPWSLAYPAMEEHIKTHFPESWRKEQCKTWFCIDGGITDSIEGLERMWYDFRYYINPAIRWWYDAPEFTISHNNKMSQGGREKKK